MRLVKVFLFVFEAIRNRMVAWAVLGVLLSLECRLGKALARLVVTLSVVAVFRMDGFGLGYGPSVLMLTVTLLDVAAIVVINPIGDLFHPSLQSSAKIELNLRSTTYSQFMTNNIGQTVDLIDYEHLAYLVYNITNFCSGKSR
ncbi:hypothetical protein A2U01_0020471 [Trifolium medium]|uniref:Uncharacterized protein n=1 Tax=Trifolium medium TaxID=97028 RepID=A0A392NHV7_9FABA|nr:hypothetical protein [Trifolium medium]